MAVVLRPGLALGVTVLGAALSAGPAAGPPGRDGLRRRPDAEGRGRLARAGGGRRQERRDGAAGAARRLEGRRPVRREDARGRLLGLPGARRGWSGWTAGRSWFRVLLPQRPNGAAGWIPAARLQRYVVRSRIVIDVSARRLDLFRQGKLAYCADGGRRPARDADPDRAVLRLRAALHRRSGRGLRARGARRVGVLAGATRVDAGRARRHPRHQRARARSASQPRTAASGWTTRRIVRLLRDVQAGTPVLIHP